MMAQRTDFLMRQKTHIEHKEPYFTLIADVPGETGFGCNCNGPIQRARYSLKVVKCIALRDAMQGRPPLQP